MTQALSISVNRRENLIGKLILNFAFGEKCSESTGPRKYESQKSSLQIRDSEFEIQYIN